MSNLRALCLSLFAALASTSPAQDFDRKVTVRLDAMPASRALRELSAKTGLKLETAGEAGLDVILLRVHDMPLADLMRRIADATACQWTKMRSTYMLTRAAKTVRQQDQADTVRLAVYLRKALDERLPAPQEGLLSKEAVDAALAKLKTSSDAIKQAKGKVPQSLYVEQEKLVSAFSPIQKLFRRLIRTIAPETIAALPANVRVTYSTYPTRLQQALGPKAKDLLRQFIQEENHLIAAFAKMESGDAESLSRSLGRYSPYRVPIVEPCTAELVVMRWTGGVVEIGVSAYDADGFAVEQAGYSLLVEITDPQPLPKPDAWQDASWDVSDRTRALAVLSSQARSVTKVDPIFADPANVDPLSFHAQDLVSQIADALHADVVACLPDWMAGLLEQAVDPTKTKLGDAAKAVKSEIRWDLKDGVLTVTPNFPSIARQDRLDREPMSRVIAKTAKAGIVTLDDVSKYLLEQRDGHSWLEGEWLRRGGFEAHDSPATYAMGATTSGYREVFRFYALLSPAQRSALIAGESIPVINLSSQARNQLAFRLFSRSVQLMPARAVRDMKRYTGANGNPTTLLPNGIPGGATVSLKLETIPGGFIDVDGRVGRFWEAPSIGYVQSMQDRGGFLEPNSGYPLMGNALFYPGAQTHYAFKLSYREGLAEDLHLQDASVDRTPKPVPWRSLPKFVLDEAIKTYDYYRKANAGQKPPPPVPR
jgi:hypothetical protein